MRTTLSQIHRQAGPFLRRLWDGGTDWAVVAGAGSIVAGVWQLSEAAGMIVLGLFLLVAAAALDRRYPRR